MGHLLWIIALAIGYTLAASITKCCKEKTVGAVAYKLMEETNTKEYGCKSNCVFERNDIPGSRFCFKEGDLEVVCEGDGAGGNLLILLEEQTQAESGGANTTFSGIRSGFATKRSGCVTATIGVTVDVTIALIATGVTSDSVQKTAAKLTSYLKEEFAADFEHDISNSHSAEVSLSWLGIQANGKQESSEVEKFYTNGSTGLNEATEEYYRELSSEVDSQVEITGSATVVGLSNIPTEFCIFFALEIFEFSDGRTLRVVANDDEQWKTGTVDGDEVANNGLKGNVVPFE